MRLWLVGALLGLWACGPTKLPDNPEPGGPPPEECQPVTCESEGKNCGELPDGCGGTLTCGSCGDGEICSDANVCEPDDDDSCEPTSCEAEGKTCGTIPDGCGGTLECGGCGEGEVCGGGGAPNVCGADACTPTTCEAQGKTCGVVSDGCGGTLTCGSCGDGESCTEENVCEAAAPDERVKWLKTGPAGQLFAVENDERGGFVTVERREAGAVVSRYTGAGVESWHAEGVRDGDDFRALAMKPDGSSVFATGEGPCPSCGGFIDEFSAAGDHRARREDYAGEVTRRGLVADASGGYAFIEGDYNGPPAESHVAHVAADGTRWTFGPSNQDDQGMDALRFSALTRDSSGNYIAGASIRGVARIGSLTLGKDGERTLAFIKLSASGEVIWVHQLRNDGDIVQLRTSAKGTVVAVVGSMSATTWGGVRFSGGPALLTLEANGTERWARKLLATPSGDALAVLGTGQAVVAGKSGEDTIWIERYELTGERLWSHQLHLEAPEPDDLIDALGVGIVDGDAIVGGYFRGRADFGDGRKAESAVRRIFLLNLGR